MAHAPWILPEPPGIGITHPSATFSALNRAIFLLIMLFIDLLII